LESLASQLAEVWRARQKSAGVVRVNARSRDALLPDARDRLRSGRRADTVRYARFFHAMLEHGVYWRLSSGVRFVSGPPESDIVDTVAARSGLSSLKLGHSPHSPVGVQISARP